MVDLVSRAWFEHNKKYLEDGGRDPKQAGPSGTNHTPAPSDEVDEDEDIAPDAPEVKPPSVKKNSTTH